MAPLEKARAASENRTESISGVCASASSRETPIPEYRIRITTKDATVFIMRIPFEASVVWKKIAKDSVLSRI
jgi:hypothetical protein